MLCVGVAVIIEEGESRVELSEQDGIHIHSWKGAPTLGVVDRYYAALGAIVDRGQPFVLLTETEGAGVPNAQVRKRIGEQQIALEPRMRPLSPGSVVVVKSTLLRGALTALSWIAPTLSEMVYAETLERGLELAREIQRASGR